MSIRSFVLTCTAAALSLAPAPVLAQSPLPAFTVTAPDGAPVPSASLERSGQWLLIYVSPGAAASDRLVQWLGESWSDARNARVVFIVAGTTDEARAHLAAKGGEALAASATWYVDPRHEAWSALKLQGTMAVAGMAGARVDWKIDGVIADPSVVLEPAAAWLK